MTKEQFIQFVELKDLINDKVESIVQWEAYKEGFDFDDVINLEWYIGRNTIEITFDISTDSTCYDHKLELTIDEFCN